MRLYANIYALLQLPEVVRKLASGEIECPIATWKPYDAWLGYPPALIPIWTEASLPSYIGYWKHWFVNRSPSYVRMFFGTGPRLEEIARTTNQLLEYMAIQTIVDQDALGPVVHQFCEAVGIQNIHELDSVTRQSGDDPKGFIHLPSFRELTPAQCASGAEMYNGEFPVRSDWVDKSRIRRNCGFEVAGIELKGSESGYAELQSDPSAAFNRYYDDEDYEQAWLLLNSPGWAVPDAIEALAKLVSISHEQAFIATANVWMEAATRGGGEY